MKKCRVIASFVALCFAPGLIFAAPETFEIDPVHSFVIFKVRHMNVGNAYGEFNNFKGTVVQDKEAPEKSSLQMEVDVKSLDTKNEKRDQHVLGPDFLNANQFPTMTFKSESAKKLSENQFELTGQFTLHGVTKPLTLKVEKIGEATDPKGVTRVGGESTFTIKRSEFGISKMMDMLGDDITVTVALEAIKKPAQ